LTLGDGDEMKLNMDLFPIYTIRFEEEKILVRSDQAGTTNGGNVAVSDGL
jgi:hypothetical protein